MRSVFAVLMLATIVACSTQPAKSSMPVPEVPTAPMPAHLVPGPKGILYFKDERVGLCFAYLYEKRPGPGLSLQRGKTEIGGPALAGPVDCDKVKSYLSPS